MLNRDKREKILKEYIVNDFYITDKELASLLEVSINTIRLDRSRLGIKEVRERVKEKALENNKKIISLSVTDIVGDILEFEAGKYAVSIIKTKEYMTFEGSDIVQGRYIYALAESLAIALVPNKVTLVGIANIKYIEKVHKEIYITAKARLIKQRDKNFVIWVDIFEEEIKKFKGKFILKGIE